MHQCVNWLKNDLKKLKEHLNSKMLSHELFDNNLIKKYKEFNYGKENHLKFGVY